MTVQGVGFRSYLKSEVSSNRKAISPCRFGLLHELLVWEQQNIASCLGSRVGFRNQGLKNLVKDLVRFGFSGLRSKTLSLYP